VEFLAFRKTDSAFFKPVLAEFNQSKLKRIEAKPGMYRAAGAKQVRIWLHG